MSDHTKGPWHFGGSDKCTIYDGFGQRIANSFEGVMVTQRSDEECKANARLIAAAPLMLEALMIALASLEEVAQEMTVGDRFTNAGQSVLDALLPVKSAIEEAKGKNHD